MLNQFDLGEGNVVWHVGDLKRTDVAGALESGLVPNRYRGHVDDTSDATEANLVIERFSELIPLLGHRPRRLPRPLPTANPKSPTIW